MTWGWDARGELPLVAAATGTTGGGKRGGVADAGKTQAWPRYEAEYLKRALQSEAYKYDASGLESDQRQIYLDRVTARYKEEADEALKAEFEQWLQGQHECNQPTDQVYENADGKPVRRWVYRSKEAEDEEGGSKVGQARAGWKHTPWGRSGLTHLPGVREYFRAQEDAWQEDLKLQLLAEHGPQNIEDAWKYFKHWVKGRPLSDTVALKQAFAHPGQNTRSDFGHQPPTRMYEYDATQNDEQPGVLASDRNAHDAAVALPGEQPVPATTDAEDRALLELRQLRESMESSEDLSQAHAGEVEAEARDEAAEAKDADDYASEVEADEVERVEQANRAEAAKGPQLELLPSMG